MDDNNDDWQPNHPTESIITCSPCKASHNPLSEVIVSDVPKVQEMNLDESVAGAAPSLLASPEPSDNITVRKKKGKVGMSNSSMCRKWVLMSLLQQLVVSQQPLNPLMTYSQSTCTKNNSKGTKRKAVKVNATQQTTSVVGSPVLVSQRGHRIKRKRSSFDYYLVRNVSINRDISNFC